MFESQPLLEVPALSADPTWAEYFWHQLPYAIPGAITAVVGLALMGLAFFRVRDQKTEHLKSQCRWFGLLCLSLGALGFILAARAVVYDRVLLRLIHDWVYLFVLLLVPATAGFVHAVTRRQFRVVALCKIASWLVFGVAVVGLVRGEAFESSWTVFSFGLYPKGSVYLKPWFVFGEFAVLGVFPYVLWKSYRKVEDQGHRVIIIGVYLTAFLISTNLPIMLGYPVFPGGNFMFLSLFVIAWGVFRADFLDANDLLFEKNGFFYFFAGLVSIGFILMSFSAGVGLSPTLHSQSAFWPWGIPAFVSSVVAFALAILVAGSNASNPLNIMCALTLTGFGFFMAAFFVRTLGLEPIVNLRVNQLGYFLYMPLMVVQYFFVFRVIESKPILPILYIVPCCLAMALIFTPYGHHGYYNYEFGMVPGSGSPVLSIFFIAGIVVTLIFFYRWWKLRGVRGTKMADAVALAVMVATAMLFFNIPSTRGMSFYPIGNLVGLPLLVMGVAVLRYGVVPISGKALTVSRRLSAISLTLLPVVGVIMVPPLLRHYSILEVVSHLTLILAPLILFGFLLMFIFARPIAAELDVSYESLAVAYDDLQNAQARLVEAEKMSSVGVMIAGIAHELNNPLAALQGEARILRKELESTDGLPSSVADNFNESVSIQEKAARRMAAIINGLRQYSRQDRDTTEQVVIRDIIDNTLAISSSRIKPIPVVVEVSDGIELVAIFPGKVSQVVGNLVVNAADACRAGDDPRIRVGVSSNAESLLIAVEDNGSGIPEEIQTKVFDPFFTTKDVGEGTGLGLALCKRFAQEMGGDLVFDTKPGATSFTLSVPLDES